MAYPEPIIMPYRGVWPRLHPRSLVLPSAAVIGDVELGEDASIWFNATVRGDDGPITIGALILLGVAVTTDATGMLVRSLRPRPSP